MGRGPTNHKELNHPFVPFLHPFCRKRRPRFFLTLPEIPASEGTIPQCQFKTHSFEMSGRDQHGFHEHQRIELDIGIECVGEDP